MKGIETEHYILYRGIPYARAGRFEKPVQLPLNPDGDYRSWPEIAWQAGRDPGSFYDREFYEQDAPYQMSEDCLYLNIWVPKHAKNAPAAMWIHGGALDHGYSYEKEFDEASFARDGIVLISIAYRVGILGYLYESQMAPEANLGLQDQLCALNWVHENIAAFGGNPDNLTVFGQSAGCMSAFELVRTQESRGKIAKAIFQSGLGIQAHVNKEEAAAAARDFLHVSGITSWQELLHLPADQLIQQ